MTTGPDDRARPRPIVLVVAEGLSPAQASSSSARCRVRTPPPDSRVTDAIADGSFYEHPVLFATMESGFHAGGRLHVLASAAEGPDGPGAAIVELARRHTVPQVFVHLVAGDGTGSPIDPSAVAAYIDRITIAHPGARIATVGGQNHVRDTGSGVRRAYDATVHGVGRRVPTVDAVLGSAGTDQGSADDLAPAVIVSTDGRIRDGDVVVDALPGRAGQELVHALTAADDWTGFDRGAAPRDLNVVTVSGARRVARVAVAYPPPAEEVPWSGLASSERPMRRISWDYRLDRLALDDIAVEEPAAAEWWEDEPSSADVHATSSAGDEAVLAELRRGLESDERDVFLAVLAAPLDDLALRGSLSDIAAPTAAGDARATGRTPLVAVLVSDADGACLEIVADAGVALRDGDLGDVAATLADLAGWAPLLGSGHSLVAR